MDNAMTYYVEIKGVSISPLGGNTYRFTVGPKGLAPEVDPFRDCTPMHAWSPRWRDLVIGAMTNTARKSKR